MRPPTCLQPRRGFSLIELCVASGLTAMLGGLMISAWSTFGKPATDVIIRSTIATEIEAVSAALADDLGGGLHTEAGRTGPKENGQLVGWMAPSGTEIWLCFDGGESPNSAADWQSPDTIVSYSLIGGNLVRWDQTADVSNIVGRHVETFSALLQSDRLRIDLGFLHRSVRRSISLEAIKP